MSDTPTPDTAKPTPPTLWQELNPILDVVWKLLLIACLSWWLYDRIQLQQAMNKAKSGEVLVK